MNCEAIVKMNQDHADTVLKFTLLLNPKNAREQIERVRSFDPNNLSLDFTIHLRKVENFQSKLCQISEPLGRAGLD